MTDRRVAKKNKGDKQIHQLRFVVGCALIGSVVAGSIFGWIPVPFDIRLLGASIGVAAGIAANHLA